MKKNLIDVVAAAIVAALLVSPADARYIRWQSRKCKKAEFGRGKGDVHWSVILAESARVDGKPTQRHIAYLVGFNESAVAHP